MSVLGSIGLQVVLAFSAVAAAAQPEAGGLTGLREDFRTPPPETRPIVVWWWFSPDPPREVLSRELERIKDSGFGGVHVQLTASAHTPEGLRSGTVSSRFLEALQVASLKAKQLGLSFDVLLEPALSTPVGSASPTFFEQLNYIYKHIEPGSSRAVSVSPVTGPFYDPSFRARFKEKRGYDLPAESDLAVAAKTPEHDWVHDIAWTIAERWRDELYLPLRDAMERLDTNALLALPSRHPFLLPNDLNRIAPLATAETWNTPSTLRLAASLSHRWGKTVIASMAWNNLGKGAHAATPLDLKISADTQFLAGATHIIATGWAGETLPSPTWCQTDSSLLAPTLPWYPVLPELTQYIQRLSLVLRAGAPTPDILLYLPLHDVFAEAQGGSVEVAPALARRVGSALLPTLLREGYSVDFIDDETLASDLGRTGKERPHPPILISQVERLPRKSLEGLGRQLAAGGKVFFLGQYPVRSPSSVGDEPRVAELADDAKTLCERYKNRCFTPDKTNGDLSTLLRQRALVLPEISPTPFTATLGFVHRRVDAFDLYFVANTGNIPYEGRLGVRGKMRRGEWWNPLTSESTPATISSKKSADPGYDIALPAYGTRLLVLFPEPYRPAKAKPVAKKERPENRQMRDLTNDWEVSIPGAQTRKNLEWPVSWTEFAEMRSFSGEAVYRKQVDLTEGFLASGRVRLSLGEESPIRVHAHLSRKHQAWIDPPVREAAIVLVNGRRVGSVWSPPYELEIGRELHVGKNDLEIRVYNVSANQLAGRVPTCGSSLDSDSPATPRAIQAQPAGLLGPIELRSHQ